MTTHSPHVLSADLHLLGVIKLSSRNNGEVRGISLGQVTVNGKGFFAVRKQVAYDAELFEALFAGVIVLWEGDSEAGFYPTLMRRTPDYPAEILSGIQAQGDNIHLIAMWLKQARYSPVAVVDGDKEELLRKLLKDCIPFVALPKGRKLEHVLADKLLEIENDRAARILIKAIGTLGLVYYGDGHPDWPALADVFRRHSKKRRLDTDTVLSDIQGREQLPTDRERIVKYLEDNKKRYVYETLAEELTSAQAVPDFCNSVINHLKKAWDDPSKLGQYQLTVNGELVAHSSDAQS